MKVLVVDDDQISRTMLRLLLEKEGLSVIEARTGKDALSILRGDDPPKLVVLDWVMPDIEGTEVCRRIRKSKTSGYTFVMILTAKARSEEIVAGLEAGADDYLAKPFNPEELVIRLRAGRRILELESQLLGRTQLLKDLIFAISHDLKTPLIAINMTIEEALDGAYGQLSDSYRKILLATHRSVLALRQMIETLLALARFDSGKRFTGTDSVDLSAVAREEVDELRPLWQAKSLRVHVVAATGSAALTGNVQNMKRLLANLIENAINFTPNGGEVRIECLRRPDQLVLAVHSERSSARPEEVNKLFQRFSIDSSRRRGIGMALGMHLATLIIEDHGGKIHYAVGKDQTGSFICEFPQP